MEKRSVFSEVYRTQTGLFLLSKDYQLMNPSLVQLSEGGDLDLQEKMMNYEPFDLFIRCVGFNYRLLDLFFLIFNRWIESNGKILMNSVMGQKYLFYLAEHKGETLVPRAPTSWPYRINGGGKAL